MSPDQFSILLDLIASSLEPIFNLRGPLQTDTFSHWNLQWSRILRYSLPVFLLFCLLWTSLSIKSTVASRRCAAPSVFICLLMCAVWSVYPLRAVPIFHRLQKCSSRTGCRRAACGLEPWSPPSAKAEARIRDGGEAYHGPLLYLDWQANSSFTQALFTKGSHPHLWESCL